MRTFKRITIIALVLSTASCTRVQYFNGYYYGRYKTKDINLPVLVYFNNNKYIDFFSDPYDTLSIRRFGNKFLFRSKLYHHSYKAIIIEKNNDLLYYKPGNDTLIYKLKKSESSNFLCDYLPDNQIKIKLPEGDGDIQSLGFEYRFQNPLYFFKKENQLVVNFNDSTIVFDENFYKSLLDYKSHLSDSYLQIFKITLIADKDLSISEINLLKEQLKIADYRTIYYMLSPPKYEKVNFISRVIPPLTERELSKYKTDSFKLPPLPPQPPILESDFIKDHVFLIEYSQGKIIINKDSIEVTEFNTLLKEKILSDSKTILAYYISDTSSYQDYINLLELISSVYYNLRDEYLFLKYGSKYRGLLEYDNKYDETIKKFPMRVIELDLNEYKKFKYAL